jgi:hypothetical protein
MTYSKPELTLLGRAVEAVQSQGKAGQALDSPSTHTLDAYEADE